MNPALQMLHRAARISEEKEIREPFSTSHHIFCEAFPEPDKHLVPIIDAFTHRPGDKPMADLPTSNQQVVEFCQRYGLFHDYDPVEGYHHFTPCTHLTQRETATCIVCAACGKVLLP